MYGEKFAEFWSIDIWEMLGDIPAPKGIDMSVLKTPQEKRAEAMKAGAALERLVEKYSWLHWMRSPMGPGAMDAFLIFSFFGGKVRALSQSVADAKGPPAGQEASKSGHVPNFAEQAKEAA